MNNLMIDIETLGTKPDAAILSIGAVFFDTDTLEMGETLELHIKMERCTEYGSIDPETVKWWLSQEKQAQQDVIQGQFKLSSAMIHLDYWISTNCDKDTVNVWAKPPSFDLVILQNACHRVKEDVPWKYYNERDVRTCLAMGETLLDTKTDHKKRFDGKHTALADAQFQVSLVLDVYDQK